MDTEQTATQGAPSAPPMVAPAEPEKPKRTRRKRNGNGTGRRGGRPAMTQAEKDEQRAKREQTERERAEQEASRAGARRQVARLAAIGALTPHLLNEDEIAGLSKFVLAMMQRAPAEQEQQP